MAVDISIEFWFAEMVENWPLLLGNINIVASLLSRLNLVQEET